MPKFKIIEPKDYDKNNVSPVLQNAVRVLNEALAIDANAVKNLLDLSYWLSDDTKKKFLEHPSIVVRDMGPGRGSGLTALGLIGGIVNTRGKHRLTVTEEDDGRWSDFIVMEEIE